MKLNPLKRLGDWLKQLAGKEKRDENKNLISPEKSIISDFSSIEPRSSSRNSQTTINRFPRRPVPLKRRRCNFRDPLKNTSIKVMRGVSKTAHEKKLWKSNAPLELEED